MSRVEVRLATAEEYEQGKRGELRTFDYTKLNALTTCPMWGLTRYTYHKTTSIAPDDAPAPLRAGKVLHECFAAIRLWTLGYAQHEWELYETEGVRLFGADRFQALKDVAQQGFKQSDLNTSLRNIAMECLATANYVEDPDDKRRTYSNLEGSLLYYVQRWDHTRYPVWVPSADSASGTLVHGLQRGGRVSGIERPFALHISCADGSFAPFLYVGRIDGIHYDPRTQQAIVMENKSATRLNDAWRLSFHTSPQVTGYTVASSLLIEQPVQRACVIGLALPLPRVLSDGLAIEMVERHTEQVNLWMDWVLHTVELHDKWQDQPMQAPRHYQSCNRYFRPCPLVFLCASPADEREAMWADMRTDVWNPLHGDDDE
jgi:hypothetical protein